MARLDIIIEIALIEYYNLSMKRLKAKVICSGVGRLSYRATLTCSLRFVTLKKDISVI